MENDVTDILKLDLENKIRFFKKVYIIGTILLIICVISFIAVLIRQSQLDQEMEQYQEVEISNQNEREEFFQRLDEIENEIYLIDTMARILIPSIIILAIITPIAYSRKQSFSIILESHLKSQSNISSLSK